MTEFPINSPSTNLTEVQKLESRLLGLTAFRNSFMEDIFYEDTTAIVTWRGTITKLLSLTPKGPARPVLDYVVL